MSTIIPPTSTQSIRELEMLLKMNLGSRNNQLLKNILESEIQGLLRNVAELERFIKRRENIRKRKAKRALMRRNNSRICIRKERFSLNQLRVSKIGGLDFDRGYCAQRHRDDALDEYYLHHKAYMEGKSGK